MPGAAQNQPSAFRRWRLKLVPVDTLGQKVHDWQVSINGEALTNFRPNSYGEMEAVWIRHDRLDDAVIVAEGLVALAVANAARIYWFLPKDPARQEID